MRAGVAPDARCAHRHHGELAFHITPDCVATIGSVAGSRARRGRGGQATREGQGAGGGRQVAAELSWRVSATATWCKARRLPREIRVTCARNRSRSDSMIITISGSGLAPLTHRSTTSHPIPSVNGEHPAVNRRVGLSSGLRRDYSHPVPVIRQQSHPRRQVTLGVNGSATGPSRHVSSPKQPKSVCGMKVTRQTFRRPSRRRSARQHD